VDRIAVVSDVHGNLTAYEAVLADIDARGITTILNLGDYVGKGPRGADCVELSRDRCVVNVRGNWDDFIPGDPGEFSEGVRWWRDELKPEQLPWLASLPLSHDLLMSGRWIRLFHASATSVHTRVRYVHTDEEFDGMFANTELTGDGPLPSVVGYGDIHDSYLEVKQGRTLFNAGSVGNALDEPTAAYVVLDGVVGSQEPAPFGIQFVRVGYDVEAEIAVAAQRGMPELEEYAVELREGIYRGARRS
jgi:predicted phosphodiesterase